jgi:thymidylate kinase
VDTLIVLKLDPKIALARRPEDDATELLLRSGEIWNDAWRAPYAHVIDTGMKSLEAVRREVLDIAWTCISRPFARLEMVGLNGTGKSTLANSLRERVPNMRTSLPYWKYPWVSFRGAFLGAPTALRAYWKTRNGQVAKNCLQLFAAASLARKFEKGGAPATNLFLDQGPVFQLVLAQKEDALSPWGRRIAIEACNLLKAVVRLDVPVDELYRRVVERHLQAGRGQSLDATEFTQFCANYQSSLEAVSFGSTAVVTVDGMRPVHEIAGEVLERVAR